MALLSKEVKAALSGRQNGGYDVKTGSKIFLAAVLSVALMTGCGGEKAPQNTGVPANGETASGQSTQAATNLKDAFADDFSVGVAVNPYQLTDKEISQVVTDNFNSITMENAMKPESVLDQYASEASADGMPEIKEEVLDEVLSLAKRNNLKVRGHCLVWHSQTPEWFFCEKYDAANKKVNKATMKKRMESYIQKVLTYCQEKYPDIVYAWDVVNEAVEPGGGMHEEETGYCIRTYNGDEENLWYTVVGADYVEKAFTYARKYAPEGVKLFYNDYNTFQPVKNEKICALLADLSAKGLVDGIGMQSYYDRKNPDIKGRTGSVQAAIENFSELGLEIHITELTINIDEPDERAYLVQAMRFKEMFQLLMELDTDNGGPANITSVTVFGLMDEYMLYPDNKEYSRFFDGDLKPKQALTWVLDAAQGK